MKPICNVITNTTNGGGLQKDWDIVSGLLEPQGFDVRPIHFQRDKVVSADLNVFLEVVVPEALSAAPQNWIFPNPELFKSQWVPLVKRFDKVLCKTREALRIFTPIAGPACVYTGFSSQTLWKPGERRREFLHVAGNSIYKGTKSVVDAWRHGGFTEKLIVISRHYRADSLGVQPCHNIEFREHVGDDELKTLMNTCAFHLCPSETEGWGHVIHEALGCGAIVISTAEAPMSEFGCAVAVNPRQSQRLELATAWRCRWQDVAEAAQKALALSPKEVQQESQKAMESLRAGNTEFTTRFSDIIAKFLGSRRQEISVAPRMVPEKKVVVYLGNFAPEHSTENDVLWSLRDSGYVVTPLQENQSSNAKIVDACAKTGAQVFLWTHTYGSNLEDRKPLLQDLRKRGVVSASFHLDLFFGLEREPMLDSHAFFKTDHFFGVDGASEFRYKMHGVNHHFVWPAVKKSSCYVSPPDPHMVSDVMFVGSLPYHKEWPYREKLVRWLRSTYGRAFRKFGNPETCIRGDMLNRAYASARVVVGDSLNPGFSYPFYTSDRPFETVGRGGFLIMPRIQGLEDCLKDGVHLRYYDFNDFDGLKKLIDYYRSPRNEQERSAIQLAGHIHVKQHHTYHNRIMQMMDVLEK